MYDFAVCGSYLTSEGYVHKDWLSAIGTSAGGLLVGAAINMYADLFCAAVLKVSVDTISCDSKHCRSISILLLHPYYLFLL